jgi:hypothetical protein
MRSHFRERKIFRRGGKKLTERRRRKKGTAPARWRKKRNAAVDGRQRQRRRRRKPKRPGWRKRAKGYWGSIAPPLTEFTRVGTLNVQRLGKIRRDEGKKIEDVAFEAKRRQLDVLFIQDLNEPKQVKTHKVGSGYRLLAAGRVGVLLNQKMWERVEKIVDFRGCDRLLAVQIAGVNFVSAYQPYATDKAGLDFFLEKRQQLAEKLVRASRQRMQIWGGDWNARMGWCSAGVEEFGAGFVGQHRLDTQLEHDEPFKENVVFARTNYLAIPDSFKPIFKRGTFLVQARQQAGAAPAHWRELDYFFVSKPLLQSVTWVSTYTPGVVTDHKLKTMLIRLKPTWRTVVKSRERRAREAAERKKKVEVRLLWRRKELAAEYRKRTEEIYRREKLASGHDERVAADEGELKSVMHEKYDLLEQAMQSAGAEVLGFVESARGSWLTPAEREEHRLRLEGLMGRRRALGMVQGDASARRDLQRDIDAERKRWKELGVAKERQWLKEKAEEACTAAREGDVGLQYQCLQALNDSHEKRTEASAEHLFEIEDVTAHFRAIGNDPPVLPPKFWTLLEELVPQLPLETSLSEPPGDEELTRVMKEKIRANAAVGSDLLHIQQLKYSSDVVKKDFFELVRYLWRTRGAQKEEFNLIKQIILWKKKEPRSDLNKYRAIALVTLVSKFLETVATTRLLKWLEGTGWLGDTQFAYREGVSTDDLSLVLTLIIEHAEQQSFEGGDVGNRASLLAVDQKKAFPSTVRQATWEIMRKLGAPDSFIALLDEIHSDARFYVSHAGESGECYGNVRGFREGGSSSPVLFLIAINMLLLLVERDGHGLDYTYDPSFSAPLNTRAQKRQCTAKCKFGAGMFADDLTTGQRAEHLPANEQLATDNADVAGHALHPDKTERLEIRKKMQQPQPDPVGRPGYWTDEIKVVGGLRRANHHDMAKAEGEGRRLKAEGQWAKWKRLLFDGDALDGRSTPTEAARLVETNVYSVLCYNVCRFVPEVTFREYERFTDKVVRELLDVQPEAFHHGGDVNMADLRLRCGLKNVRIYIERRQLQYLNLVIHRPDTCPVKKLLWARFPGRGNASPPTCKYFHDLAVRAVGADYLQKDKKQFATAAEVYLEKRQRELDGEKAKSGGDKRQRESHRYRRPHEERHWEDWEEELAEFDAGTLGKQARVEICPRCKCRMLIVEKTDSPTQKHHMSMRTHVSHCKKIFDPARFDQNRMLKCPKRYWQCKKCGERKLTQELMWDHVQLCF